MMATNRSLRADGKCRAPTSIVSYALAITRPKTQTNTNPLILETNTGEMRCFSLNET